MRAFADRIPWQASLLLLAMTASCGGRVQTNGSEKAARGPTPATPTQASPTAGSLPGTPDPPPTAPPTSPGATGSGRAPTPDAGTCVPNTCATAGASCGTIADGCGGALQCGACSADDAGVDARVCVPLTCTSVAYQCGPMGDGCGNVLDCGSCPPGSVCGGSPSQCVQLDGGDEGGECCGCAPATCAQQGIACGPAGDGCGNLLQCGECAAPGMCGGGDAGPGHCG